jgi:alkanesulfonate monooxygenase SsuD/methylene tetrahydromethanopterin reductase-like flavin-dependent oxidoreductase (luciferase family)
MPPPAIGVFLPSASDPAERPGDVAAAARHAEDLGFESVWAVDQLVAGTGAPVLDPTIVLAAAAVATSRIRLAFGVLIAPLRPVAWIAKQVASLQHVSEDRVILGVGAGGDRHERSWAAAGIPRGERGRRTDAALAVLPDLIAGKPTSIADLPGGPTVQLAPAAVVPPIVVGGMSDPAMTRAARHADGWFALPLPPAVVRVGHERLGELAAAQGRPAPALTASMMTVISGDAARPDDEAIMRRLTAADGLYSLPEDDVPTLLVVGDPEDVAARLSQYGEIGAERVVITLAAGNWYRQADLLAEAREHLAGRRT